MIEIMPESNGSLLAVRAVGILTHADYRDVLVPKVEEIIKQFGSARVLLYLTEACGGWQLHAAWDDASFGIEHRRDFEKVAVVGGPRWVEWAAKVGALLLKGEVKTFAEDDLQEALDWIQS